ncbi:MAG: hypothetical protein ACXWKC_03020 [Xanthobacteraceae bacterium]
MKPTEQVPARRISSPAEAASVVAHLNDVMDALLNLVEDETALVREGRLAEVQRLEPAKSALARDYMADTAQLEASRAYLAQIMPSILSALRTRHDRFRALLQVNLTVLATVHAVSEGIVRGVNMEMQRRKLSHGYTAAGQRAAPNPKQSMPLTLSRSL